jgi:hypothetical protein
MKFGMVCQSRSLFGCTLLLTCWFGGAAHSFGADKKPVFVDPTVRLAPNATRDVAVVKIKIDGLAKAELESTVQPQLIDATQPVSPGTVTFSFVKSEDAGPAARIWYFAAAVESLPFGQTQRRQAELRLESIKEKADYNLTNQTTAASNWTVLPPPDPWVVTGWVPYVHCTAIGIIPGDSPATDLQLKQSGLVEQSTKKPLGLDALRLCSDAAGSHCGAFDLAPHSGAAPLYVCVSDKFSGHGNYRGALNVSAMEKPETQSVSLNIYVSSFCAKLAGFLVILAGVVLAWLTKVYASNRLTRDQELLPLTLLRRRVEGLQSQAAGLPVPYQDAIPGISEDLNRLLNNDLTTANLDANHFIHPATPTPFNTLTIDSAGYKTFLSERDAKVNLLTVLLQEGVKPATGMASGGATQPNIVAALHKLDLIRGQNPLPSEVQARAIITQQILPALVATIAVAADAAGPERLVLGAPASFDRLLVEISGVNLLVWGVTALLTSLVGLAVLILNNPGFGIPLDYVYCLFWGFGIPTAVQQLNAGSAMNAVGVSLPK